MTKHPRFIQIAVSGDDLFALDESGTVWCYTGHYSTWHGDLSRWSALTDQREELRPSMNSGGATDER